MFTSAVLIICTLRLLYIGSECVGNISVLEYEALETFYVSTNGQNWSLPPDANGSAWSFPAPLNAPCSDDWFGIVCKEDLIDIHLHAECSIVALVLPGVNLHGEIPSTVSYLTSLVEFLVGYNYLAGHIPSQLGSLTALKLLDLNNNELIGRVPTQIAALSKVNQMYLYSNYLSGPIPSQLGAMTALTQLYMYDNCLSGPIPSELSQIIGLREISLYGNMLSSSIPQEFGQWSKVSLIYFHTNQLTGIIPSSLGNITTLSQLALFSNYLTAIIPSSLGDLRLLTFLFLYTNYLTGTVPPSLGNLNKLTELLLYTNILNGTIPSSFGNLVALEQLYLQDNYLTGTLPIELGNLRELSQLDVYLNSITGTIPSELSNLAQLTELSLYANFLRGTVPTQLGELSQLVQLALNYNSLTGSIPSELGALKNLAELYLDWNSFSGTIPTIFGKLLKLDIVYFNENSLEGKIPSELGDLEGLTNLYLGSNYFTGKIPTALQNLKMMAQLIMDGNRLSGAVPSCLSLLNDSLRGLNLAANALEGPVPTELGGLRKCSLFNLSSNSLTGRIPPQLGQLGSALQFNSGQSSVSSVSSSSSSTSSIRLLSSTSSGYNISGYNFSGEVVVDLSQNSLTGSLPVALFSTHVRTVSLYSNCFTGSLPPQICASSRLETLVLDKLSSGGEGCGEVAVAGFVGPFALNTLRGSIPSCLWDMPRLRTLHLSGNGLRGQIGDIPPDSLLVDLDVSNNFLTGSIPVSLQSSNGFRQLALANNKLTGTLSSSFSLANKTLLTLSVNRLSGAFPASLAISAGQDTAVATYDVLSGNLFSCGSLPAADPSASSYVCGSTTLDYSLYTWCGCCCFLLLPILGLFMNAYTAGNGGGGGDGGDEGSRFELVNRGVKYWSYFRDTVAATTQCGRFLGTIDRMRRLVCLVGALHMVLYLPAFIILKQAAGAGILADQYAWVTTSAFLHGYTAAAALATFVGVSTAGLTVIIRSLNNFEPADDKTQPVDPFDRKSFKDESKRAIPSGTANAQDSRRGSAKDNDSGGGARGTVDNCTGPLGEVLLITDEEARRNERPVAGQDDDVAASSSCCLKSCVPIFPKGRWRDLEISYVLQRVLVQVISIGIVSTVNVLYVYALLFGQLSTVAVVALQAALSVFKLLWKQLYIKQTIKWIRSQHPNTISDAFLYQDVAMNVFNFILGPCLATLGTDSNCLYNALIGEQAIESSFNISLVDTTCITEITNFGDTVIECLPLPLIQEEFITITPPWFYSYQCASALLTNYVPVLVFIYVSTGILLPIFEVYMLTAPDSTLARAKAFSKDFLGHWGRRMRDGVRPQSATSATTASNKASRLGGDDDDIDDADHDNVVTPDKKSIVSRQQQRQRTKITSDYSSSGGNNTIAFYGPDMMTDLLVDVAVLMTFGLAAPLLAAAIILKQLTRCLFWRLWVGSFLLAAESLPRALTQLERAAQVIRGGVFSTLSLLLCVVCLFWSGMLFDMVADIYGNVTGTVFSAVMFCCWVAFAMAVNALLMRFGRGWFRQIGGGDVSSTFDPRAKKEHHNETFDHDFVGVDSFNAIFDSEHRSSEVELA